MHYRSIFISDTHLGCGASKANILLDFLKSNTCDTLYLVGDIIDGWKVAQNRQRWKKTHTEVVMYVLGIVKAGKVKVIYVPGNHDEFLRPLVKYDFEMGLFEIHNQYVHIGVDGKRYLVTHGDMFDGVLGMATWVGKLGDTAYDIALWLNTHFNSIRHELGMGYWSLSQWLKQRVKQAVSYIFEFELLIVDYCKRKGYDGVICGHIHHPEIKNVDGIIYMNDGDWVESCSSLVETVEGIFQIVYWSIPAKKKNIKETASNVT